jgi:hypothetical protein
MQFEKLNDLASTCTRYQSQTIAQASNGSLEKTDFTAHTLQFRMTDFELLGKLLEKCLTPILCISTKQNVIHMNNNAATVILCNARLFNTEHHVELLNENWRHCQYQLLAPSRCPGRLRFTQYVLPRRVTIIGEGCSTMRNASLTSTGPKSTPDVVEISKLLEVNHGKQIEKM